MNPLVLAVICIAALLGLLALGVPIAYSAGLVGFVGLLFIAGPSKAMYYIGSVPYAEVAVYAWTVMPLFILMGHFFHYGGYARDLFSAAQNFVGRLPGGLAIATVLGGSAFAAASGSSVAAAAVLGKICIPEMERHGYNSGFAAATVAACGNLASMIPPSVLFVIYGIMIQNASVSKLLLAGVFPGLVMATLFILSIILRVKRRPKLAPLAVEKVPLKERLISLKGILPILILMIIMIGGLYTGVFTPTEAGAAGATAALVMSLFSRKMSRHDFLDALLDAGRTTTFVLFIIACVLLFARFLTFSGLTLAFASFLSSLELSKLTLLVIMVVVYLIMGCFFDSVSMLVLTLPVFGPVVEAVGFDPIWMGVVVVLMCEVGLLTPPVGMNVFVVQGVAPHIAIEDIFKGILPYVLVTFILLALLTLFPQIALFLPSTMK